MNVLLPLRLRKVILTHRRIINAVLPILAFIQSQSIQTWIFQFISLLVFALNNLLVVRYMIDFAKCLVLLLASPRIIFVFKCFKLIARIFPLHAQSSSIVLCFFIRMHVPIHVVRIVHLIVAVFQYFRFVKLFHHTFHFYVLYFVYWILLISLFVFHIGFILLLNIQYYPFVCRTIWSGIVLNAGAIFTLQLGHVVLG